MNAERRALLAARRIGPAAVARIIRLNPSPQEGERLRGWHPGFTWRGTWHLALAPLGKRQFIAKYGREAWAALRPADLFKSGRRRRLTREAWLNGLWRD